MVKEIPELRECSISELDLLQTIDFWADWLDQKKAANIGEFMMYGGRALRACRELQSRRVLVPVFTPELENNPLTLAELRERDGKPVKVDEDGEYQYGLVSLSGNCFTDGEVITLCNGNFYQFADLDGNVSVYPLAYDHPPKEE